AKIEAIRQEILALTGTKLYELRVEHDYKPVIGAGSLHAPVMFIGEAPGKNEAETGKPFVGASGRVLDELLASIDMTRDDVYITNIVNDRPPKNRDPRKAELELYAPFLDRQIEIIQPKVIATLGRFSMAFILKRFDVPEQKGKISELHGTLITAKAGYGPVKLLPLYHPAASLYNPGQKPTLFEDFKQLKAAIS
ncbi:MAG: uracil-DNA glycosylase, partial [Chloroflexota bacterium]